MKSQDFDQGGRKFWGTKHFPHGIARSGEFTIEQARLLEAHGYAYEELAKGLRAPQGAMEKDFVAFCNGKKAAESVHEKAWQRYVDKTSRTRHYYSLNGVGKMIDGGGSGGSGSSNNNESFDLSDM